MRGLGQPGACPQKYKSVIVSLALGRKDRSDVAGRTLSDFLNQALIGGPSRRLCVERVRQRFPGDI